MGQQDLGDVGGQILDAVKARVGAAWESWSEADKQLAAECAADAAVVGALALAGDPSAPREKAQIDAQLANLQAAGAATARSVFWATVVEVIQTIGATALKVLLV